MDCVLWATSTTLTEPGIRITADISITKYQLWQTHKDTIKILVTEFSNTIKTPCRPNPHNVSKKSLMSHVSKDTGPPEVHATSFNLRTFQSFLATYINSWGRVSISWFTGISLFWIRTIGKNQSTWCMTADVVSLYWYCSASHPPGCDQQY